MLQVEVSEDLLTRFKIALLKSGENQKSAIADLLNLYINQEPKLKE